MVPGIMIFFPCTYIIIHPDISPIKQIPVSSNRAYLDTYSTWRPVLSIQGSTPVSTRLFICFRFWVILLFQGMDRTGTDTGIASGTEG